ncbi:hypothetical protein POX_d06035 [Penicillium oxalicum]|uniref:hypothetical protein n=1 Tax=Penicillium oxalicum TaxID=69781 RepID=UPI0020B8ED0A|nr:hypothetical protein POX_d06035 [Penicillium oxalicum]KAI2790518.1 hypothetical protein POX_d06035 [Penicillium oxalicum]
MIPPCDPCILEQNTQFKRVYENVTKNLLNPDGSSCAQTADPARKIVEDSGLSDECRDTLAIISLYLETAHSVVTALNARQDDQSQPQPRDDTLTLLTPTISSFYASLPCLIAPFSNILSDTHSNLRILSISPDQDQDHDHGLARQTDAVAPSARDHQSRARARDRRVRTSLVPAPKLAVQLGQRIEALRRKQIAELPTARREMVETAAQLMNTRAAVLERLIVILERVKHGTLARAMKAQADNLAVGAQVVEGKIELTRLEIASTLHTPETLAALNRYQEHLHDTRARLEERKMNAIAELKKYGWKELSSTARGNERGGHADASLTGSVRGSWNEIAGKYAKLLQEVESVRMEIERLGE